MCLEFEKLNEGSVISAKMIVKNCNMCFISTNKQQYSSNIRAISNY